MRLAFETTGTISHRLIDRYLMVGLSCVLGSVGLAIWLATRGVLFEFASAAAAVPLALLLLGALLLRRTLRLNQTIEAQLRSLAELPALKPAKLKPVPEADALAIGWNKVLERLEEKAAIAALEERLGDTLCHSDGRRWEAVFNGVSDGIAVTDKQGRAILTNNAFWAIVGGDRDRGARETLTEVLSAAAPGTSAATIDQLAAHAGVLTTELRRGAELSDGVIRVSRAPIMADTFDSGSAVWTLRDVTAQKLGDEMRNQFVFTATHELRTPIANIRAYAETLALDDSIDVEQQKGFYNTINAEAGRLARLIDELLNVSQMESGSISLARHETDVARLLQEVIAHLQAQIQQKALRFESRLPAKLPKLALDKDKIAAALVNLLGNAIKYTPAGGQVRLIVELDDNSLYVRIEDTGIGIAPEDLPHLWEKFYRSSDSRVQSIGGSGLGLAFSQEVARLHGGRITVSSVLDQGSQFTLALPLS
jgi:two-component system phosphate regulon sensor histidine kinase PhoR